MTPHALLAAERVAGPTALSRTSDERLVNLLRSGYESAFDVIVCRYREPLQRYCASLVPATRVDDVVQQTFVNAYVAVRRSDTAILLRPWLYRIAHNAALDVLRDPARNNVELDLETDGVERPDQVAERRERLNEVVASLQALPRRQRDAMVLRELGGESYDDIAENLGVTRDGVRQLLVRARTRMRDGMAALIPPWLLRIPTGSGQRVSGSSDALGPRVAEVAGGAGASAGGLILKAGVAVLVAGGVVGGVATNSQLRGTQPDDSQARAPGATALALAPAPVGGIRRIARAQAPVGRRQLTAPGAAPRAPLIGSGKPQAGGPSTPSKPAPTAREYFQGSQGILAPGRATGEGLSNASPDPCAGVDGAAPDHSSCSPARPEDANTTPAPSTPAPPPPGTEGTPGHGYAPPPSEQNAAPAPGTEGIPAAP